ncbi:MAG TPA: hypothetical protein VGC10_08050 [Sphingomonas sp.]
MARRILLPLLLLAGCHKQSADPHGEAAGEAISVFCALAGAATFKSDCTIEKTATGDGLMLVIHHPDGGFRRLTVTTDGRGVIAADGSQPAEVSVVDPATIEVAVGADRYRLPATVKGQPLPVR